MDLESQLPHKTVNLLFTITNQNNVESTWKHPNGCWAHSATLYGIQGYLAHEKSATP